MRRILLGAMVGSLSLPLYASTDGTVYEFFQEAGDLDRRQLVDAEKELKESIALQSGEEAVAKYLNSTVRSRLSTRSSWESRYTQEQIDSIEKAGVSLSNSFSGDDAKKLKEEFEKTKESFTTTNRKVETLRSDLETKKRSLAVKQGLSEDLRGTNENRQAISELSTEISLIEADLKTNEPKLETLKKQKETQEKSVEARTAFENGTPVDVEGSRTEYTVGDGVPFKVVQKLQVVKGRGDRKNLVASYEVELDDSIPRSSWSTALKKKFENFSDGEIDEFLKTEVNEQLKAEHYRIGDLEDFKKDDVRGKIMGNLKKELSTFASSKIFSSSSGAFKSIISDKLEELSAEQRDPQAKLKIAEAVRKNPTIAKTEEPCRELLKVIGKNDFAKLSAESRMECEGYIAEQHARADEDERAEEIEEDSKKEDMQQAEKISDGLEGLRAHCAQLKQEAAMRQKQVEEQIAPLFLALSAVDAQTFKCEMLGTLAGDLAAVNSSNPLLAEMSKNNPFLNGNVTDPEDMAEKAQRVAASAPKSLEGMKKLEKQHKCISESLGLAGASIAALQTFGQAWAQQNPEEYQKRLQQALKIQTMSQALTEAIQAEQSTRGSGGVGTIRAMSTSSNGSGVTTGGAGQVQSLGSSAGMGAPVRIRNSNDTRVERGLSSGTVNGTRTNSSTGAGASGNLPPPNFLGD